MKYSDMKISIKYLFFLKIFCCGWYLVFYGFAFLKWYILLNHWFICRLCDNNEEVRCPRKMEWNQSCEKVFNILQPQEVKNEWMWEILKMMCQGITWRYRFYSCMTKKNHMICR